MNTTDFANQFGLTGTQASILFALERLIAINDVNKETPLSKDYQLKRKWVTDWTNIIKQSNGANESIILCEDVNGLAKYCNEELNQNPIKTWFYLTILESVAFVPYFSITNNKDENKKISKLKFKKQIEFIQQFVNKVLPNNLDLVERYDKMYCNAIWKGKGGTKKVVLNTLTVITISAIAAVAAVIGAPGLSVALVGTNFVGLNGAALVSACLAYLGGGAIAAGGFGIAGGVCVLAGGGALLGGAIGGGAVAIGNAIAKSSPKFALSQAAKLDVVLREIVLNNQKDLKSAQEIINNYLTQIDELKRELNKLKNSDEKNKNDIKNLKKSIEYMEMIFNDMRKFKSSFETGLGYAR